MELFADYFIVRALGTVAGELLYVWIFTSDGKSLPCPDSSQNIPQASSFLSYGPDDTSQQVAFYIMLDSTVSHFHYFHIFFSCLGTPVPHILTQNGISKLILGLLNI